MYKIGPHLYLSNYFEAKSAPNDWYIINCSKDLPMISTYGTRLAVNDDLSQEAMQTMNDELPRIINIINQMTWKGGNVLVHCFAGQQRSAVVVASYLMTKGMSKVDAIRYIRGIKPDAFRTGVNFDPVLTRYSV
jgi:predicted metal-dependent RNase